MRSPDDPMLDFEFGELVADLSVDMLGLPEPAELECFGDDVL